MKKIILRIFYALQIHRLMRFIYRNRVIILMYHGFTGKAEFDGITNYHRQNLHIDKFKKHLAYLKRNYNIIALDEFVSGIRSGKKPPPCSIIITIDDGYKSNYSIAFPILMEFNVPASIFLTTNFIGEKVPLWSDRIEYAVNNTDLKNVEIEIDGEKLRFDLNDRNARIVCDSGIKSRLKKIQQETRDKFVQEIEKMFHVKLFFDKNTPEIYLPLEWDEISEMRKSGLISFGSHTHSHYILPRCNPETIKNELLQSKKLIEGKTGVPCTLFCYPNGNPGDFNESIGKMLKELGYSCALTTVSGFNDMKTNPYELMRIGVGDEDDMIEFIMKISGVMKFLLDFKKMISKR